MGTVATCCSGGLCLCICHLLCRAQSSTGKDRSSRPSIAQVNRNLKRQVYDEKPSRQERHFVPRLRLLEQRWCCGNSFCACGGDLERQNGMEAVETSLLQYNTLTNLSRLSLGINTGDSLSNLHSQAPTNITTLVNLIRCTCLCRI